MPVFPLSDPDGNPTTRLVPASEGYVIASGASASVIQVAATSLNVLVSPPWVGDDLKAADSAPHVLSPSIVRRAIQKSSRKSLSLKAPAQVRLFARANPHDRSLFFGSFFPADLTAARVRIVALQGALLLRFCLSDVVVNASRVDMPAFKRAVDQLRGFALLPTASGTLHPVGATGDR